MSTQQAIPAWRFFLVALLLGGLAALLIWQILSLQVLESTFLNAQGDARTIRKETIPAYRGVISDRNGEPLAVSTPVVSIWANPQQLMAAQQNLAPLAKLLDLSHDHVKQKINNYRKKSFVYLRRQLPPSAAEQVKALGLKGVYSQREYKRFYPAGEVAAHLVGFTNIDGLGQEGMELAYDHWLKGSPGSKKVLKDLHGHVIRDIQQKEPAVSGNELALSIDLRLQSLAYRQLKAALKQARAKSGSVVLLDIESGEVLAMVNQPSYNPNNRRWLKPSHMRNRAVTDVFEPGSTMKALTVVAALESGKFQPTTLIDTSPGYIKVGKKTLLDPVNYGVIDLNKILVKSSQVGTSKVALALEEGAVREVLQRFGFGRSTASGFPGESAGILPGRAKWRPIERVTLAYGYGLSVTPLQLAQAYGVLANNGVLQPISLIKQESSAQDVRQIITPALSRKVIKMLELVIEEGSGKGAQIESYSVAGKTGTVHKSVNGHYADDRYRAIFAGIAPASDPRLVAVVMIDEPKDNRYYGGEVAAPVFSKVMTDALRILNITPDQFEAPEAEAKTVLQFSPMQERKSV